MGLSAFAIGSCTANPLELTDLQCRDGCLELYDEHSMPSSPPGYEEEPIEYVNSSLIDLEYDDGYFPCKFKKYMDGELKWSRLEISGEHRGDNDLGSLLNNESEDIWVFWSRQDDDRPPSYDNFMDLIPDVCVSPKIRGNIRHALEEMISNTILGDSLVQFWAPIKTLAGRTLLTIQHQPFALGRTPKKCYSIDRERLCEYRMMCMEYKFNADAESGEDQLGLPGRVFLHQFPESTPDVKYYSKNEYPQLYAAIQCLIKGSWALPLFEGSSQTCVGVLEIASHRNLPSVWHGKSFLGHLCDIFQRFGLRIFDGYRHCEMQSWYRNKASTAAFQELEMVCQSVCKIHNLPLALTWVACSSCNDLLRSQHQFRDQDYFNYPNLSDFMEVSTECYLRKGVVTGRILTSPNLLYCSDVKQLSIAEYPLVPYARRCKLSGWFTMCLRSSYTGNEFYVLEFFLPRSSKCNENVTTRIKLILGTMEENFSTFKLASGQELGEVLSVEVLDFQNVQKSRSVARCIPSLEPLNVGGVALQLRQLDQSSMDVINNGMNVISKAQTDNLPILKTLQNGKAAMQLDTSDQQPMDSSNIGATRCIPGLEPLKAGALVLQLGQCDQYSSMDAINNGMNVVSEAQTDNWPSLEPLQSGEVAMLLDSSDQQSMDPSNNEATRCVPSLEPLKAGGLVLQLGQWDQSSMDAINNGMNVVSEAQTDDLPCLEPLRNGEVAMQLDSADQQSMDPLNNGATRCIPSIDPLKVGGVVLQLGQLDKSSMDAINNGMNVITDSHTDNLPSLEPLQNGEAAMQLASSDQQSMDLSNTGQNVGTMERNIIVVSSPEEGTRKAQEKERSKTGVRIKVSFKDILKCSKMSRNNAARKLKVSMSRLKRVCSGYGIYRWPPRKINMVSKICWGFRIYRWPPRKMNMVRKINTVRYSRPLPFEDQEQITKLPSDVLSDQASSSVANTTKMQEMEHETTGARIDVSFQDIPKCSKMSRNNAGRKQKAGIPRMKRVYRGYGIDRCPPRKINTVRYSQSLPVEYQEQIPKLPSDVPSDQASIGVANTRKTQEEHKTTEARIDVSFEDTPKCSKMNRSNAERKLKVGISRMKRVYTGNGIDRWPPRKISMVHYSRSLPVEYQDQISKVPCDVPSDQASTSVDNTRKTQEREHKTTGARIDVSFEDILKCSEMSRSDAARKLKVSISGLKRVCRGYGIYRWPPRKILPVEDQVQIPRLTSCQACVAKPGLQDDMVTIKAKSEIYNLRFRLPLSPRIEDLKQEVAKRLKNLGAGTYYVKYKDEEDELILIACDEDLQDCIRSSRSLGNSTVVVYLDQSNQLPT